MRTPRTMSQGISEVLRLVSLIVAADHQIDAEARRRAEYDVEVAAEALRRLARRLAGSIPAEMAGPRPRAIPLSTRERRVVDLLVANKTYKDIACEMGISVLSAQSRVKNVYMKLAVHSKAELRALVHEHALAVEMAGAAVPVMDPHPQPVEPIAVEEPENQP